MSDHYQQTITATTNIKGMNLFDRLKADGIITTNENGKDVFCLGGCKPSAVSWHKENAMDCVFIPTDNDVDFDDYQCEILDELSTRYPDTVFGIHSSYIAGIRQTALDMYVKNTEMCDKSGKPCVDSVSIPYKWLMRHHPDADQSSMGVGLYRNEKGATVIAEVSVEDIERDGNDWCKVYQRDENDERMSQVIKHLIKRVNVLKQYAEDEMYCFERPIEQYGDHFIPDEKTA